MIDAKLTMHDSVDKTLSKARPKLKALLRTIHMYSTKTLVNQYKTHVQPITESTTSAIYHAATSTLEPLDRLYTTFIHAIDLTPHDAFIHHNFAPPQLRRDIAMLGLLHKITLHKCHEDFHALFPAAEQTRHDHRTRLSSSRHNRQLHEHCDGTHTDLTGRSLLALATIYNLLPQHVVDAKTTSTFQTHLTNAARHACLEGLTNWPQLYSPRLSPHPNFYTLSYEKPQLTGTSRRHRH